MNTESWIPTQLFFRFLFKAQCVTLELTYWHEVEQKIYLYVVTKDK